MKHIHPEIPFEELPFHLHLTADATVFISADMKRLALKAKAENQTLNITKFIENCQQVLSKGTLIIPAYTDYLKNGDTFNPQKGKPSTGAISNKVFKRSDFKRTKDPLHSVFVWGKGSSDILALEDTSTFGKNSIFSYLHANNAVFLFFDVHIENSFTYIHYVEEYLNVPYRSYHNWTINIEENGVVTPKNIQFHMKKWGVLADVDALNEVFFKRGAMERYDYSGIYIDSITADRATPIITEKINNKEYLYRFSSKQFLKSFLKKLLNRK